MPLLPIAIQLSSLRLPLKRALTAAQQLGASAVELDARGEVRPKDFSETGLRQLRKMIDDLGLRVAAVDFQTRRGYNVQDDLEERVAATKEAMRFARALGASLVVNQIGRISGEPGDAAWQTLVEVLTDLGNYGHHVGAMMTAETGTESGQEMARLLATLPQGALGITLDPGNLVVNGFSAREAIEHLGGDIVHVHATDGVRDLAHGRGVEVALGRGAVDYPELLASLEERGYRGYLSIERQHADDPLFEVGQAVKYLSNVQ